MKNKKKIRERPIDYKKSFQVIKDLDKEKLKANNEELVELNNIEKDLKKVLEYYDKRKKNQIPKAKIINSKNEKNENINNYYINNNIIYKDDNSSNAQLNSNEYNLNYKLNEFIRPNNYIIYSSSERNKIKSIKKEYEAKEADFMFLKIRENFMKIEELENIVIDFENNFKYSKDEKFDEAKARKIIETKYSKYKNNADSIINHFKDRRNTIKNSLLRKNWLRDKTFHIRKENKIKTRKNTQNLNDSLNKIIESKINCKEHILPLLKNLYLRNTLDRHLLKVDELIFQSECDKIKDMNISDNIILENNKLKVNLDNIIKNFEEPEDKKMILIDNNNILTNGIGNNNILNKSINDIKSNQEPNSVGGSNERKNQINKINSRNKSETIFPPLNYDCLKKSNNIKSFLNNKNSSYRIRIRINRCNKISVDRYIQTKNDFNPFHDSFNKIINSYKKYNSPYNSSNIVNSWGTNNFENLLNEYNLNIVKSLPLDESDDDYSNINNDIKQFSNLHRQYIKSKRNSA